MRHNPSPSIERICKICGIKFKTFPCRIRAGLKKNKIYGRYCSKKCKGISMRGKTHEELMGTENALHTIKILKARTEDRNPHWKGDKVSYEALHDWITSRKPKPEFCVCCGVKSPIDLANISQEYHRDVNDFEWLCRKCHMTKDGRLKKLNILNSKKGGENFV